MRVSWISLVDGIDARGPWDTTIIDRLLLDSGITFDHSGRWGGGVVVFPARHHVEQFDKIQERISRHSEIVVIAAGDEEGGFPWWELEHSNMRLWVQHPPSRRPDRILPLGPTPHAWTGEYDYDRTDFYFAGQVTHAARHDAVSFLRDLPRGTVETTGGFMQGVTPTEYVNRLAGAKIAPSPSGPVLADTFRLYEAIENGCFPVVDDDPPHGEPGYWQRVYGEGFPVPVVRWNELSRDTWESWLAHWPANANQVGSWWQQHKRQLARTFRHDLLDLYGPLKVDHPFTVIIPTSPIPTHPDTKVIDETVRSIRERTTAPILILADGVRPEQWHLTDVYEAYLHQIIWKAGHEWDATVVRFPRHVHQAAMTKHALSDLVDTTSILFVEHDTPLVGDIPLDDLAAITDSGAVNVIRLHHETSILADHMHLIEGHLNFDGIELARTTQWSQRPHLANKQYYRRSLHNWFKPDANTMIEDRMHGVIQSAPWGSHRVAIYMPDGASIKRSTHLDARGTEPKYEETFTW